MNINSYLTNMNTQNLTIEGIIKKERRVASDDRLTTPFCQICQTYAWRAQWRKEAKRDWYRRWACLLKS